MKQIRGTKRVARRAGIALLAISFILFIAGCGMSGTINGQLVHDYTVDYLSVGGFPSTVSYGVDYPIVGGTYNCYYTLYDNTRYYPGPTYLDVYSSSYSVTANPATSAFVSGADSYFTLYLANGGLLISGAVQSIVPLTQGSKGMSPRLGTYTSTEGGLLITVTNKIVHMTADDLSRIQQTRVIVR
jgi:hypothetical protein